MSLEDKCDKEHMERWKEFEVTSGFEPCQDEYCLNYCPIRDKDNCPMYLKLYLNYNSKYVDGGKE